MSKWGAMLLLYLLPFFQGATTFNESDLILEKEVTCLESSTEELKTLLEEMTCKYENLQEVYRTANLLKIRSGVNQELKCKLMASFEYYEGPEIDITSGKRGKFFGNKHSKHLWGGAIDVSLSEELLIWLESDKGKLWLEEFDLKYFVEFTSASGKYYKFKRKYNRVVLNKNATGSHIHLELKTF